MKQYSSKMAGTKVAEDGLGMSILVSLIPS